MQKFKQGLEIWGLQLRTGANSFLGSFTHSNTADRTYTLPNNTGTIALTSDIPAINETLQTVTNRGATTSVATTFTGGDGSNSGSVSGSSGTPNTGGGGGGGGAIASVD